MSDEKWEMSERVSFVHLYDQLVLEIITAYKVELMILLHKFEISLQRMDAVSLN